MSFPEDMRRVREPKRYAKFAKSCRECRGKMVAFSENFYRVVFRCPKCFCSSYSVWKEGIEQRVAATLDDDEGDFAARPSQLTRDGEPDRTLDRGHGITAQVIPNSPRSGGE